MLKKLKLLSKYRQRNPWLLLYGSKWVVAGALIFNPDGQLLLIYHRFRQAWEYPMGASSSTESPLQAARREVSEEVGLHPDHFRFIGIEFLHHRTPNGNLIFTFGATVTHDQAAALKLEHFEATDHRWVTRAQAMELISPRLQGRLGQLLEAYDTDKPIYLETGKTIPN